VAISPIWFDAAAERIAQINAGYEYSPSRLDRVANTYTSAPPTSLLLEPFFNQTVCYAQEIRGMCANGTTGCPPRFGTWGDFGTPFSAVLGMYYQNTSHVGTSEEGEEVWEWTWDNPTLMPNGTTVNITRNYTYYVAPLTHSSTSPKDLDAAGAAATAPRALRRFEWTQGLPNGGAHSDRLCTVVDYTQGYVAGPPDASAFAPPDGVQCVWP